MVASNASYDDLVKAPVNTLCGEPFRGILYSPLNVEPILSLPFPRFAQIVQQPAETRQMPQF
jgi:hypothetical protein